MTVTGAGLMTTRYDYTCDFQCGGNIRESQPASPSSTTQLVCKVPRWEIPSCLATVTVKKGLSAIEGSAQFSITAAWQSISPTTGPNGGGTQVLVAGVAFNNAYSYTCDFAGTDPNTGLSRMVKSTAYYQSATQLLCLSPQWPSSAGGSARVSVSEAGATLPKSAGPAVFFGFTVGGWSSASPSQIFLGEPINMTVSGVGFNPSSPSYYLKFSTSALTVEGGACIPQSSTTLLCPAPNWTVGEAQVLVSLFQGTVAVGKTGISLYITVKSSWNAIEGSRFGSILGGDTFIIQGEGFVQTDQAYFCAFSGFRNGSLLVLEAATDAVDTQNLLCRVPGWDALEQVVNVSLVSAAGVTIPYTGQPEGATFQYVAFWAKLELFDPDQWELAESFSHPIAGDGGSGITIYGVGFSEDAVHLCLFTCVSVPCPSYVVNSTATYVSSSLMTCVAPAWPLAITSSSMQIDFSVAFGATAAAELQYRGAVFDMFYTAASFNPRGLAFSGNSGGGVPLTLLGSNYCYRTAGGSCLNRYKCEFIRGSGSTEKTAYAKQCSSGPSAGSACVENEDCGLGACSDIITATTTLSKVVNDTVIICNAPIWSFPSTVTLIRLIDVTYVSNGVVVGVTGEQATFDFQSFLDSLSPYLQPASQNQNVTIVGSGFDPDSASYRCTTTLHGETQFSPPVAPISPTLVVCEIPAWYSNRAAGIAEVGLVNTEFGSTSFPADGVNITYFREWLGMGTCPTQIGKCYAGGAAASGGSVIEVLGWGLSPLLYYEIVFTDQYNNTVSAPVDIVGINDFRLNATLLTLPEWPFPTAITTMVLFEALDENATRRVIPFAASSVTTFEFEQILYTRSASVMPEVGCAGGCWPFQLTVTGKGFNPNSTFTLSADGDVDFPDYKCVFEAGVGNGTVSTVTSDLVEVVSDSEMICTFGSFD
eukprot:690721-Rhodomonas_salina.1